MKFTQEDYESIMKFQLKQALADVFGTTLDQGLHQEDFKTLLEEFEIVDTEGEIITPEQYLELAEALEPFIIIEK